MNRLRWVIGGMLALVLAPTLCAQPATTQSSGVITAKVERASGVYEPGETVRWTVTGDVAKASYAVKHAGATVIERGHLDLSRGPAVVASGAVKPGTLLLEVENLVGDVRGLGGAVIDPFRIGPTEAAPADFGDFWSLKLNELAAVPPNPRVEQGQGDDTADYFLLRLANIRGKTIHGQLAKPKKPGKFPALLILQYAGVYGLPKGTVTGRADGGWLALNIMAHDLPLDRPKAFYDEMAATQMKDYARQGNRDRETSYFLPMYLACYRAAEYLTTRDDWDGRTLVVMGTSQGGQLSLVTAGLHPKVSAVIAHVPGGCDVAGLTIGRMDSFPRWAGTGQRTDDPRILATGRYFDTIHFAARIRCPALVSAGLLDVSCPPTGVLAAFNQIPAKKEAVIMPEAEHKNRNGSQKAYYDRAEAWLDTLVKGQPAPIPQ